MPVIQGTTVGGASGTTLPKPGQFANMIPPQPIQLPLVNLTNQTSRMVTANDNAATLPGQPTYPTGSFVPIRQPIVKTTSSIGATGGFGAMRPMNLSGSAGRSQYGGGGGLTIQAPIVQTLRPVAQNLINSFSSLFGSNSSRMGTNNPEAKTWAQQQAARKAGGAFDVPLPPGYGYRSINNGETQADIIRRRQINQLTTPYGTMDNRGIMAPIVNLTGAKMVQPVQTGFPGTSYKQPIPISNATLGIPTVPPVESAYTNPVADYGAGYGYGGYPSYGGYGGYGGGGGGGGYGSSYARVLNWRVATG